MTWNKKNPCPESANPIFAFNKDESYVVKAQTPIQQQRSLDRTPHTATRRSAVGPSDPHLYLDGVEVQKSDKQEPSPLDADALVKSYMAKNDDLEEEEKGLAFQAGKAVAGAAKTAGKVVGGAVRLASRAK